MPLVNEANAPLMLLWFAMNVALPLMPLALVAAVGWLLDWRKQLLDLISDGQLYFFSVTICAVFTFDAVTSHRLDPALFIVLLFALLTLMSFFTVSMVMVHGRTDETDHAVPAHRTALLRKLSLVSVIISGITVGGICYGRSLLQMG